MTLYIFLTAWAIAAVVVGLTFGRLAHIGNPIDEGEDWAAVQSHAWQDRRAEWARRQIEKIEDERQQAEAAQRWKWEVSNQGGE